MTATRERTLLIIKPDGVQRGLIGEVMGRIERRGIRVAGLKMMRIDTELAHKHYQDHAGKPFFEPLVAFMTSSPVVVAALEGLDAVKLLRNMMGALKPEEAAAGTMRGDLTLSKSYNVVHGSDSPENGAREVALFFRDGELFEYPRNIECWLKEENDA